MKKILTAVICILAAASSVCIAADREHTLKVYNWADYIDEDLIEEFEQWYEEQTGEPVEIIYQLFDINEVMLSKIEKGHEDFDVVCPSEYIIERMLRADLLLPIDKDFGDTPNYIGNVAPFMNDFLSQVDGNGKDANDYAVPYMWGTVGITYNPKYVSAEEVSSWDVLKDPRFEGKVLMKEAFRDVYTTFNIALNRDRIDSGETTVEELSYDASPESIARVEAYLNEMKPNIAGWEADFGKEMMTKEKAWMNLTWSGDAQWAIEEAEAVGVPLDYVVPADVRGGYHLRSVYLPILYRDGEVVDKIYPCKVRIAVGVFKFNVDGHARAYFGSNAVICEQFFDGGNVVGGEAVVGFALENYVRNAVRHIIVAQRAVYLGVGRTYARREPHREQHDEYYGHKARYVTRKHSAQSL